MRQYQPSQARPGSIPNMRHHIRRAAAAMLIACAAALGAGTAAAETLISNLGQTTSGSTHDLSARDASQAFSTGSTADAYELTGVKVEFSTVPTGTATVTAIITDGQATTDNVVATLTNPGTWATTSTFTVASGISLEVSTIYYLIIDASDGTLATTSANGEDSGGVTGWSIANGRTGRNMTSDTGLGGTWEVSTSTLHIAVEGTAVDNTDATLSALSVSGATLSPTFSKQTTAYKTEAVANSVTQVTITPKTSQSGSTIAYRNEADNTITDASSGTDGFQLNLVTGSNIIKMEVGAPNGLTTKTYTISVLRLATSQSCSAAASQNQIWTAQLTVGLAATNGFIENDDGYLSDKTITYKGTSHTVANVSVLDFFTITNLYFGLASSDFGTDAADLVLHVGSQQYRLEDATLSSNTYTWSSNLPTFNNGDGVCLALTEEFAPGAPTLTAAAKTESINLTWTMANHGTSNITRFDYRIKETSGGTYPATWTNTGVAASNTGGTFTLTGLTDGTEYSVQVRGVNGQGEGEPSNEVMATPDAAPVVSTVAITSDPGTDKTYAIGDNIVVTFTFDKNITLSSGAFNPYATLSFDARKFGETTADIDCTVAAPPTKALVCTHVVVEHDEDSNGIEIAQNALDAPTSHVVGPLGQRANHGHPALAANANHKIDGVRPTLSSADATSDLTKIVLTFSEAIGTVDRTKITLMSGANTLNTTADSINGTKVEITLTTALTPSDTMVSVALALDAVTDGPGNGIDALAATSVNVEAVPSAPTSLTATAAPDTTPQLAFDLSWTAAGDGGSAITKHQYRYKTGSGAFGSWTDIGNSAAGETNATSYTVKSLTASSPPTMFTFGVRAVNTNGDGAESNQATETVDVPYFPAVTATAGDGQISLEWNTVANNGSAILRHEIQRHTTLPGTTSAINSSLTIIPNSAPGEDNANSLTVSGLTNGTTYSFSINAVNSVGTGLANTSNAVIPGTTPTAPRSLSADAGDAQVHLSWTAPSSNGGNTITGYEYQQKAGTNAFSDWMDIDGSDDTTTEHTVTGLANGVTYTFKVRAVNPMGGGTPATTTATPIGAEWQLTLTRGGTNVTSLTEGGLNATVTVRITNSVRFTSAQTITIQWSGQDLGTSPVLKGFLDETTVVIDAGQASGTLAINAPQQTADGYSAPQTAALTALLGDVEIAESIDLTIIDQSPRPELSITEYPRQVSEGDTITIELEFDRPSTNPTIIPVTITDTDTALSGTVPTQVIFGAFATDAILTLTTAENTVQNDGASTITFALGSSTDGSYNLASPSSIQITVLDDDTAPARPQNLRGAPSDGTVTLTWDLPRPSSVITGYEIQRDGGSWTDISGSNANTTTHTVSGLTNDTAYTFGIRAENGIGRGQAATVTVTPRNKGIFIERTTISEGETTLIDIIPEGAPFDSHKQVAVVLASRSGPDQPRKTTDFVLNDLFAGATADAIASRPVPGFPGTHPTYGVIFSDVTTTGELRLYARDDAVSECREELYVYAYVDEERIATSPNVINSIVIEDDDRQPRIESATINGQTVTLTFDQSLELVTEPSDANDPGYQPNPPQSYFSLFTGVYQPGVNSAGTLAEGFSLSGRTVRLTFPNAVTEGTNAWVRYDRFSKWAPLGVPQGRPCAQAVGKGTWALDNGQGATTNLPELNIADAEGTEGTDAEITFTVTRTGTPNGVITVNYTTVGGSALANNDFTARSGSLAFGTGQTSHTIRVPIIDDRPDDNGDTFTVVLSSPVNATIGDGTAVGTIRNSEGIAPPTPDTLTASFTTMPSEHGGPEQRFTFDLAFSENVKAGFRKIRDHAFTVTGGDVKKAKRKVQGSNQSWTITVEPDGWGNVSLSLPGNRACTASGGICTYDNRQLANSPSATIRGPAALSVADATANENDDAGLEFAVTLDRASTLTVTVDYATSNGTATAGQDYTATSGTLTFNAGDTARTITVPLLNDAIDDGGETMTLTLSNADNARIADGTATGTIENSDPLQQAWIARFGRTVASDVVDGITERLANRGASSEVQIAGVTLQHNGSTWTETPREDTELGDTLEDEHALESGQTMSARDLMLRSSFRLQGRSESPGGHAWGAWGRFSTSSFDGKADGVTLSGDVTTGLLGADIGTNEWTAGIALSAAKGDGPFELVDDGEGSENGPCDRGTVQSTLTSVHPYAQLSVSEKVDVWAIAGHGTGDMTIDHTACDAFKTDIDMTMAAAGVRGQVMEAAAGDPLDATIRTDVLWLRATSDRAKGLLAAQADVTRLRMMIDAGRGFTAGAGTLTPTIEAGVRHDAGDAEEGVGFEVGAGLAYQGAGITIEGKVRTLIAHDDSAYEEWGASAAIRIDPGSDGRGMSLSITPTWGNAASEAEQLWSTRTAEDLVGNAEFEAKQRLDAELGYGLRGPGGWGTLTPYGGFTLADGAERTLRTGLRWKASNSATVGLEATREESTANESPSNALMLRATVRF